MSDWNWGIFVVFVALVQIINIALGEVYSPIFSLIIIIFVAALLRGKLMVTYKTYVILAAIIFALVFLWMDLALVMSKLLTYLIYFFMAVGILGWVHDKITGEGKAEKK